MGDRLNEFYEQLEWTYAQGKLEETERFLLQNAEQMRNEQLNHELIAVCNELGSFYRCISQYARSLAAFEEARALAEEYLGTQCSQYATILNNMAGTCRLMRDYQRAIALFLESEKIYRDQGEQESYAYASVLNNLSLVYRETKQLDKAIEYLQKALILIEKMPEHRHEIAVTYNNLTALYYASGDKERAMFSLNRAMQEFEKCSEEENVHYAAGLNSLAGLLYAEGECERALMLYRRSAKYTLKFFGENAEYAITCQNMYWVYKKMGRNEEAVAVLEKAERIYSRLFGAEHERTLSVSDELNRMRRSAAT